MPSSLFFGIIGKASKLSNKILLLMYSNLGNYKILIKSSIYNILALIASSKSDPI